MAKKKQSRTLKVFRCGQKVEIKDSGGIEGIISSILISYGYKVYYEITYYHSGTDQSKIWVYSSEIKSFTKKSSFIGFKQPPQND